MGRLDDKIVTIRFNPRELEMLESVVKKRTSGWWDTRCSIIKDIIREEYCRLELDSSAQCITQRN